MYGDKRAVNVSGMLEAREEMIAAAVAASQADREMIYASLRTVSDGTLLSIHGLIDPELAHELHGSLGQAISDTVRSQILGLAAHWLLEHRGGE